MPGQVKCSYVNDIEDLFNFGRVDISETRDDRSRKTWQLRTGLTLPRQLPVGSGPRCLQNNGRPAWSARGWRQSLYSMDALQGRRSRASQSVTMLFFL